MPEKTDPAADARAGWRIRAARADDAAGLSRCMTAAYAAYQARLGGERLPPLETDYAAEIRDYPVWVVERDGRIVGGLIMTLTGDEASIANIAVDPACQGQGIGGALIRFAEARARERGHGRLDLATHALLRESQALYRHLGWRETARDATRVFMRKWLEPTPGLKAAPGGDRRPLSSAPA